MSREELTRRWELADQKAGQHERAGRDAAELREAWADDSKVSKLYAELHFEHARKQQLFEDNAQSIREILIEKLKNTIPTGAEQVVPYLEYLDDGGCFTYNQYIQTVAEQENENNPISTADSPEPF